MHAYLKCTGNSSGTITLIAFQPIVEKPVNIQERRITFLAVLSTPHIKKVLNADTTMDTARQHKQRTIITNFMHNSALLLLKNNNHDFYNSVILTKQ